jgi:organic anion transporter 5A
MTNWGCTICGQWSQFLHYVAESGERVWHKESKTKKKNRKYKGDGKYEKKKKKLQKILLNDEQMDTTTGYIVGRMVMWLDEWLCGWMNGYVAGWMVMWLDEWLCRWMNGYVAGWMVMSMGKWLCCWKNRYVAGWMVMSMDERVCRWMNGCIVNWITVLLDDSVYVFILQNLNSVQSFNALTFILHVSACAHITFSCVSRMFYIHVWKKEWRDNCWVDGYIIG